MKLGSELYFNYALATCLTNLFFFQIRMLDLVLKLLPADSKEPQTARILLYKLFYDQTDEGMTHFLINLLKSFDTYKQPRRSTFSFLYPHARFF